MRLRTILAAALVLPMAGVTLTEAKAASVVLDFEIGGLGYTPTDNQLVGPNTFNAYNVRFVPGQSGLAFEEQGDQGSGDDSGFVNDPAGTRDTERPDAAGGLGEYFLRQTLTLGSQQNFNADDPIFSIQYLATPTGHISGEIWDIDGNNSQGTEKWVVSAFDASNNLLNSVTSPVGTTTNNGDNPFQAGPWTFAFDPAALSGGIDRLDFLFHGTKTEGIGVAFDNFQTGVAPVPVPAALPLLVSGLGALGFFARRRRA
jgi:hypothetical protein